MSKTLQEKLAEALAFMENVNFDEMELGRHDINEDFFLLVQKYNSKESAEMRFESHKNYVDIQYVVEGKESIEIAPVTVMEVSEAYVTERDVEFYKDKEEAAKFVLTTGGYAILYPTDAHKPGVRVGESVPVKKMVGKVRI